MNRLHLPPLFIFCAGLALAGCNTTRERGGQNPGGSFQRAIEQPLRDLSILKEKPTETLRRAARAPYQLPEPNDCASLDAEIALLAEALGPDIALVGPDQASLTDDVVSGAVRSAMGLPMRGILRRLTGAERRDRVLERAILAGLSRRSFLNGVATGMGCRQATR